MRANYSNIRRVLGACRVYSDPRKGNRGRVAFKRCQYFTNADKRVAEALIQLEMKRLGRTVERIEFVPLAGEAYVYFAR